MILLSRNGAKSFRLNIYSAKFGHNCTFMHTTYQCRAARWRKAGWSTANPDRRCRDTVAPTRWCRHHRRLGSCNSECGETRKACTNIFLLTKLPLLQLVCDVCSQNFCPNQISCLVEFGYERLLTSPFFHNLEVLIHHNKPNLTHPGKGPPFSRSNTW